MNNRPFTYGIETLPWEECARLIQREDVANRKLMTARVNTLARAVAGDRFYMTHQGVAFDPAGRLIDGQHRVAAHAKEKRDYVGLVCRYTSAAYAQQVMAVFDSGRSRSMADGLAIGGLAPKDQAKKITAVCNVLFDLYSDRKGTLARRWMDLQETANFYQAHRDAIDWCVAMIPDRRGSAYVRASFALAWEVDASKTAELNAQIQEGTGVPGSAAALWNRAHAAGLLTTGGGYNERREVALRALRILKAHLADEPAPSQLRTTPEGLRWMLAKRGVTLAEPAPLHAAQATLKAADVPSHKDKIEVFLRTHPGASVGDVARTIYGSDTAHDCAKTRSLLCVMQKQGRARCIGHGKWQAPAPADAASA
jgi:hypothetical protein